jgi:chromosome segregation ATPase
MQNRIDSLQIALDQKTGAEAELINTFNTIQEGFRLISEAEGRVYAQKEKGLSSVEQVKTDMAFIAQTMKDNRELIAQLKQKLATSNTVSAQMKQTMDNLTNQLVDKTRQLTLLQDELATKNIHIAALDSVIAGLHTDLAILRAENQAKDRTISVQDKALNEAWYVYGTKKELKEQGILDDRFLAKDRVLQNSDFNKDYFTQIDIREDKIIKLHSKSAKLLTTHPDGSYEFIKDEKEQQVLLISDPVEFWSVSRYLVIQVK